MTDTDDPLSAFDAWTHDEMGTDDDRPALWVNENTGEWLTINTGRGPYGRTDYYVETLCVGGSERRVLSCASTWGEAIETLREHADTFADSFFFHESVTVRLTTDVACG
jgi:hypothetical protein